MKKVDLQRLCTPAQAENFVVRASESKQLHLGWFELEVDYANRHDLMKRARKFDAPERVKCRQPMQFAVRCFDNYLVFRGMVMPAHHSELDDDGTVETAAAMVFMFDIPKEVTRADMTWVMLPRILVSPDVESIDLQGSRYFDDGFMTRLRTMHMEQFPTAYAEAPNDDEQLQKAIEHCGEVVEKLKDCDDGEACSTEHSQLKKWLEELKALRELHAYGVTSDEETTELARKLGIGANGVRYPAGHTNQGGTLGACPIPKACQPSPPGYFGDSAMREAVRQCKIKDFMAGSQVSWSYEPQEDHKDDDE